MAPTSHVDETRQGRSLVPQSRVVQVGVAVAAVFFFIGLFVVSGATAAMFGIWGTTVLLFSVGGYTVFRLWYSVGS